MVSERRLPLVAAPVALIGPRAARVLLAAWPALERAYRADASPVPPELDDLIAAVRVVAR